MNHKVTVSSGEKTWTGVSGPGSVYDFGCMDLGPVVRVRFTPEVPDPAATIAELRLRLENGERVVMPKCWPSRTFAETRAMFRDWEPLFNVDGKVLVTDPHASKVIVRPGTVRVTPPESLAHLMPAEGGMP